jgi:hypothetical protein
MADIELVIKIPEEYYNILKTYGGLSVPERAILKGTPLPKGHGDLADKKEIIERYKGDCGRRIYADEFIHDIEVNVPTIIEKDGD